MGGSGFIISQRRQKILDQVKDQGVVRVADLATALLISELTVRRDLDDLAKDGLVERFHGGARFQERPEQEILFTEKDRLHTKHKDAIGAMAESLVKDGDTVFLNAGSTTLAVLRHLGHRRIRIITNNAAAPSAIGDSRAELILVGGEYRARSSSLFGDLAILSLSQIHATLCILGTNGITARNGLTTSVQPEAAINRLMAERCEGPIVVVADGSKIGVTSSFACLPIAQVSTLITDNSAHANHLEAIKAAGIQVLLCPQVE
jgi:DeoR/GlpR family transcriptional regulator of sugar metabolism